MNEVVVTGGAGFLGRYIVRALHAAGLHVRVLDHSFSFGVFPPGIQVIQGDVGDRKIVRRALAGADLVIHLACTTVPASSEADRFKDFRTNVLSTIALLECAVQEKIGRFVFPSSGGTVYGLSTMFPIKEDFHTHPISSHGVMKLTIESYLRVYKQLHGLEGTVLRLSNPYGPGQRLSKPQGFIGVLAQKPRTGLPIEIFGDGSVVRDFVFVEDVAEAFVHAARGEGRSGTYNIGSGIGYSLRQVIAITEEIIGYSIPICWRSKRDLDVPTNILDISKAREELRWVPKTGLTEGIRRTLTECRALMKIVPKRVP